MLWYVVISAYESHGNACWVEALFRIPETRAIVVHTNATTSATHKRSSEFLAMASDRLLEERFRQVKNKLEQILKTSADDPTKHKLLMVLEYVEGGSLFAGTKILPKKRLSELQARKYFRDVLQVRVYFKRL